ncbi:MAG: TRAP transporter small permease [Granulosicoccus sp.]
MQFIVDRLARLFAVLGGLVLSALVLMTCLSIVGRSFNAFLNDDWMQSFAPGIVNLLLSTGLGPVNGDFELVEAGMAFAIFAFLPLCQLSGSHASVDIFTSMLPERAASVLRLVVDVVFAMVLVIIAVQLFSGMLSKRASGQTTLLLQFPLWWAYAASLSGAFVAAFVSCYVAVARFIELQTGRTVLDEGEGADH